MVIYLIISIFIALIGFFGTYYKIDGLNTQLLAYSDPIVVMSSVYLLLFFTKINIQSNVINFISASSFAVFLLHLNPWEGEVRILNSAEDENMIRLSWQRLKS